jgi:hypothetical protein
VLVKTAVDVVTPPGTPPPPPLPFEPPEPPDPPDPLPVPEPPEPPPEVADGCPVPPLLVVVDLDAVDEELPLLLLLWLLEPVLLVLLLLLLLLLLTDLHPCSAVSYFFYFSLERSESEIRNY